MSSILGGVRRLSRHRESGAGRPVAGIVLLAMAVAGVFAGGLGYASLGSDDPGHASAAPTVEPSPRPRDRPMVPATPRGMLALLSRLLPPGRMSEPAGHAGATLVVDVRFDRAAGWGRIRVVLGRDVSDEQRAARSCANTRPGWQCRQLVGGVVVHLRAGRGCWQDRIVEAVRPDGTQVRVEAGSCAPAGVSASPGGVPPAPPGGLLDADEARRVAADGRWGWFMDPELLETGRSRFRDVAAVGDPDRPL